MDAQRDTILQIIDQQKGKMTSEQFWCVALLSGAFGALVLNASSVLPLIPHWTTILLCFLVAVWGTGFVRSRHANYVELQETFARLVEGEKDVPAGWHARPRSLSETGGWRYVLREHTQGSGSYAVIIWVLFAVVVIRYVQP
jgi:hypothetical protein